MARRSDRPRRLRAPATRPPVTRELSSGGLVYRRARRSLGGVSRRPAAIRRRADGVEHPQGPRRGRGEHGGRRAARGARGDRPRVGESRTRSATSPTGTRATTRTASRCASSSACASSCCAIAAGASRDRDDELDAVRWFPLADAETAVGYASEQALVRRAPRAARARAGGRDDGARLRPARRAGAEPRADDGAGDEPVPPRRARRGPARRGAARRREPPPARGRAASRVARLRPDAHPSRSRRRRARPRPSRSRSTAAAPASRVGGRPLAPATLLDDGDEIAWPGGRLRRRAHAGPRVRATAASTSPSGAGCSPATRCSRPARPSSRRPTATWRAYLDSLRRLRALDVATHLSRARTARRAAARRCSTSTSRTACCASGRSWTALATDPIDDRRRS